jgi:hypothetical protein
VRTALFTCIAATALAFGGVTGVAHARTKHKHHHKHHHAKKHTRTAPPPRPQQLRPESFDGSCEFSGAVTFTPPMTSTPQSIAQHADAPGTCSGRFVDQFGATHQLENSASRYRADSSGDQVSCEFGMAAGTGTLTFPYGEIAFAMNEYRGGATPLIRLTGTAGGEAWMPVTPSQGSDPTAAVQACNGAGLDHFELDAHMQTMGALSG